jgi:putative ABC transport system permease protein
LLAITLADLRFRMRQFLIAVVGAGVVFGLAILLTGMVNGFYTEIDRTVASVEADAWVLQEGTSGPFTSVRGMSQDMVRKVARRPGVTSASGLAISLQNVDRGQEGLRRIMMIGARPGGHGTIDPDEGDPVRRSSEAVADRRLGMEIGDTFALGGRNFTIVGLVDGLTMLGGTPDVWMTLRAAQDVLFQGQKLITAIAVSGTPESLPRGMVTQSNREVEDDSLGPMEDAVISVGNTRWLMWGVAVIIVAALVYVSALQRTRDFAVMKAVGASSRVLFFGLAVQAVVVTLAAAVFAACTSWVFLPAYTVPVEVPLSAYLWLPVVAVVVGVLSSLVAVQRAVKVDPALAFGAG